MHAHFLMKHVALYRKQIELHLFYSFILWIFLSTLAEFQPKSCDVSCNLAENLQQNTSNPNISHILIWLD